MTAFSEALPRIAVLGDSRVFDTYFVNNRYGSDRYGYQDTFPHLLRGALLRQPEPFADLVHIPDHFRGATIENNIIRLALIDPAMVILVDGIWESLLSKRQFLDFVRQQVRDFDWRGGDELDLTFSSARVVELFIKGRFEVSPDSYANRIGRILSYFRRRRRSVVWANLPIVPSDHLDRIHYAGDYVCIPEWGQVLSALNERLARMARAYGAETLDLDDLMSQSGGPDECLIDQWHFTPHFHAAIARKLLNVTGRAFRGKQWEARYPIMPGDNVNGPVAVVGQPDAARTLQEEFPGLEIAGFAAPGTAPPEDVAAIVVTCSDSEQREATARDLIAALPDGPAILYPEDLRPLGNPSSGDRAQHGNLS